MADVVAIHGATNPTIADPDIIAQMEDLLAKAKAGVIRATFVVYLDDTGSPIGRRCVPTGMNYQMIGAVAWAQHRYVAKWSAGTEPA